MDDDGDDDPDAGIDDNDYDDDDDEPAPWDPVWEKGFNPAPPRDSSFMFLQIKAGLFQGREISGNWKGLFKSFGIEFI